METLSINSPYPFPLGREGATANFLTKSGNTLQISIPDITEQELFCLKKGKIKAGFIYQSGDLIWLFQFFDKKGIVFTLDAPFNVRLIPKDLLALHDIKNQRQRLVIDLHVVDRGIVRVLGDTTMPNNLTVDFLSAAQDQVATLQHGTAMQKWMKSDPDELTKLTKMHELGK